MTGRTGVYEAQLGMDSLLERAEHDEWVSKARFVISACCLAGVEFTAETVRAQMDTDPPEPYLFGAVFRAASNEGWITHVGYRKSRRPDAHGRPISVWRSAS